MRTKQLAQFEEFLLRLVKHGCIYLSYEHYSNFGDRPNGCIGVNKS